MSVVVDLASGPRGDPELIDWPRPQERSNGKGPAVVVDDRRPGEVQSDRVEIRPGAISSL